METGTETGIYKYVKTQMELLARDGRALEQGGSKAQLAQLRRGVGKSPENFLNCGACF